MTDLERKVLDTIAARRLRPTPAYVFLAKRSVFWALAVVSILLGALSVAILLFVVADYYATDWRVLDNIHFNEALIAIPLLWLVLAAAFTASAVYGLRQTRRGYRFTISRVATVAFAASVVLGIALNQSGLGHDLHVFLANHFQSYRDFTYVPFDEWSRPDEGYLGGTVLSDNGRGTITLQDFHDHIWEVDVSGADIRLDNSLVGEGDIAIEGERTGPLSFRARIIAEFD